MVEKVLTTETSGVAALVPKAAPPSGERNFPARPDEI